MVKKKMVCKGDVIQANELTKGWTGCLLIVDKVMDWGVQAGLKVPMEGTAYIRLKHEEYDWIGMAALVPEDDDDEQDE